MTGLRSFKHIGFFLIFVFGFVAIGSAAEKDAERYAPVYTEPLTSRSLKDPLSALLELPFRLIKYPMDKGLIFTENHRLDKKTLWVYERMVEKGFTPLLGGSETTLIPYYGGEFNLMAIAKQKEKYPDFIATATIMHGPTAFFLVGSEVGAQRIAGTGLHAGGLFQYHMREKEPFYGIGPKTSRGEGTSFKMETTQLTANAGYNFSPSIDLSGAFTYRNVNITNREHDGKGDITKIFANEVIPGLNGERLLSYEAALSRDTRDSRDQASKGSYQKFLFKYTDGTDHSSARYFTYLVDMAKYFQIASPRRVLVPRFFMEYNQQIDGGTVPFFEMAKLGSSGTFPTRSQTARAFVYNRFYAEGAMLLNLEYRYTVMQYKDFKLNTALFVDEGQVFSDFGKIAMKYFKTSYGVGFYLSYAKTTLLAFSVAHGNEGTQFYIDNKIAF
ncbi:MAG TPA: BamA/TamA family outer membrane protein [Candidatus Omnitrophota bacterium]|nr:BamA/TamA family outer membrane protein [Candidatus Omnitrophota bacterium]HRY85496.1 BamA/TamA family outer membrane protein [Candidatus Omnitrophota bacterium]